MKQRIVIGVLMAVVTALSGVLLTQKHPTMVHRGSKDSEFVVCYQASPGVYNCLDFYQFIEMAGPSGHEL